MPAHPCAPRAAANYAKTAKQLSGLSDMRTMATRLVMAVGASDVEKYASNEPWAEFGIRCNNVLYE